MEPNAEPQVNSQDQPLVETVVELQKLEPELREVGETEARQTIADNEKVEAEENSDVVGEEVK